MLRPPAGSENSVLPHFALQHPVTFRRVVKKNFSQKDDTVMETITVGQTLSVGVNGWVGVVQASSGLPPPSDQGRFPREEAGNSDWTEESNCSELSLNH